MGSSPSRPRTASKQSVQVQVQPFEGDGTPSPQNGHAYPSPRRVSGASSNGGIVLLDADGEGESVRMRNQRRPTTSPLAASSAAPNTTTQPRGSVSRSSRRVSFNDVDGAVDEFGPARDANAKASTANKVQDVDAPDGDSDASDESVPKLSPIKRDEPDRGSTAPRPSSRPATTEHLSAVERFTQSLDEVSTPHPPAQAWEEAHDAFHEFTRGIFEKADHNHNGFLSVAEFMGVLRSPSLAIPMDGMEDECFDILKQVGTQGMSLDLFTPFLRSLLMQVYSVGPHPEREWCQIGYSSASEDALPLYLNRKNGRMTYDMPEELRSIVEEEQNFELFSRSVDGLVVTTYVDEKGKRLYLDPDTQMWLPCTKEWLATFRAVGGRRGGSENDDDAADANRFGVFVHPVTGLEYRTCITKEQQSTTLYFDENCDQWRPMPLTWESLDPAVAMMLRQIDNALPKWQNLNEQVLALRANNYSVPATIAWKRAEIEAGGGDSSLTVADSVLISSLEEAVQKKTEQVTDMKKAQLATQVILEELENDNTTIRHDLEDAKSLVLHQQKRIFKLEEKLEATERTDPMSQKAVEMMLDTSQAKIKDLEEQLRCAREGGAAAAQDMMTRFETELDRLRKRESELMLRLEGTSRGSSSTLAKMQFELTTLRKKNERIRFEALEGFAKAKAMLARLGAYTDGMRLQVVHASEECEELRRKYKKEALQRKLLYNKIQEMRGNIRVFCRCRRDDRVTCSLTFLSPSELLVPTTKGDKVFEFDRVYSPAATQAEVYEDASPIITSCIDGYNVCFLAYGQTGSGKTHTMMGPPDNRDLWGVNRRAVAELFDTCAKRTDSIFTLKISLMEIYNENVYDLLSSGDESLKIRTGDGEGANYIDGITECLVNDVSDVARVLEEGDKNRSVAATKMNAQSSRSHLLLVITVHGVDKISKVTSRGKLTLVDLAGSERVAKSEATGQRLTEAAAINKSLSTLGMVFQALGAGSKHIPYRNSKLTHILEDSIGGDAKTCMFINISPAESNLPETLSTLLFGQNVTKIEMGPVKKNVSRGAPTK